MMKKGSRDAWPITLREFTNGKSDRIDPKPMLQYFEPLIKWLKDQNLTDIDWACDSYINNITNTFMSYDSRFKRSNKLFVENFSEFSRSLSVRTTCKIYYLTTAVLLVLIRNFWIYLVFNLEFLVFNIY